ncbi:TIGR01459 family HAD-type hydrolase [Roseicyclus mahoneyensis]|uniref:HAD superfamily hydrolase (TIGR01459 family) n=1 Tax=Roseicyclus mahoneyensis TaxID=164332 RepID=A0A316H499_9RHOB|nr:TIGR01459 family HAD-type hydrolase [Roseicyclus mahoneyensis]PWK62393.1 HAD superfamily hydrolase (TIGR01459 family) [Roseicyclus mahoneyensis]
MTDPVPARLTRLIDIAPRFGAIVLDQWGVLHDGTRPYPGALAAVAALKDAGVPLAVLSNSGKRAAANARRITAMGFAPDAFDLVMTSGEALWQDIMQARVTARRLCPIERATGDAAEWAAGLAVTLTRDIGAADAVLLMGLPDGADPAAPAATLSQARALGLPVLCTNPDRASPRAGGLTVTSPGALAHDHAAAGGAVRFYGKPHLPVFRAVEAALGLPPERLLMVGDSLEHDIAGAHSAGWTSAFVEGGLHAADFAQGAGDDALARLAATAGAPLPDFTMPELA